MKNIVKGLVRIANELDRMGFYKEADQVDTVFGEITNMYEVRLIDKIVNSPKITGPNADKFKYALKNMGKTGDVTTTGRLIMDLTNKHAPEFAAEVSKILSSGKFFGEQISGKSSGVDKIRKELGMSVGYFDKAVANALKAQTPKTWEHIKKNPYEKASVILEMVKKEKGQKPAGLVEGRRGEQTGTPISVDMPKTPPPPKVDLGSVPDAKLPK